MKKSQISLTKTSQKIENMENETNVSEVLTETQENVNAEIVNETLTVENLTDKIKDAKRLLNQLNDKFDFDETNAEIIATETLISKLLTERKTVERANEKLRLENLYNETLTNAKNDLLTKLYLDEQTLETLIADAKNPDAKSTLIQSFNIVFGKKPLTVDMGVTGKSLTKQIAKSGGDNANGFNITKNVKAMLSAGNSPETIVNVLLKETDMDETKAKKRLNDIKWGWEIENGLREKPKK